HKHDRRPLGPLGALPAAFQEAPVSLFSFDRDAATKLGNRPRWQARLLKPLPQSMLRLLPKIQERLASIILHYAESVTNRKGRGLTPSLTFWSALGFQAVSFHCCLGFPA